MPRQQIVKTRFAPSPTGFLHMGHAFSALTAFDFARKHGGHFILRIEDIDQTRCRPEFEEAIYEDLSWLGLTWETPARRQSDHFSDFKAALDKLENSGTVYPCFCTRSDIAAEIARSPSAPHGPEGALYPGTCRNLSHDERGSRKSQGKPYAIRLDVKKATALCGAEMSFEETCHEPGIIVAVPDILGDFVVARKDTPTSYHLSVVVDDALQGITHVIRGTDLLHATHVHRLLQELLVLPTPIYHHHPLLAGPEGKRLAKRDQAQTIRSLREAGLSAEEVVTRINESRRL